MYGSNRWRCAGFVQDIPAACATGLDGAELYQKQLGDSLFQSVFDLLPSRLWRRGIRIQ